MQEKDPTRQPDRESHIKDSPAITLLKGRAGSTNKLLKPTEMGTFGGMALGGLCFDGRGVRLHCGSVLPPKPRLECACHCAVRMKTQGLGACLGHMGSALGQGFMLSCMDAVAVGCSPQTFPVQ